MDFTNENTFERVYERDINVVKTQSSVWSKETQYNKPETVKSISEYEALVKFGSLTKILGNLQN